MASNFPGSLDTTADLPDNIADGNTLNSPDHATLHNTISDAVIAVETKMGIGSSTAVANTVFRGTGTGTSAWAQVNLTTDVTGTLPVGNGGTGVATITGIIKGNGASAFSAAVSGTDYAPATSGSSILSGNGSGGFSSVTIGSGLNFSGGTLSSTAFTNPMTTLGDIIYENATPAATRLAGNTTTTKQYLSQTGTGSISAAPAWAQIAAADLSNGTTGSGSIVLATSPTLVTPALGTPSSVTLTNGTGLPISSGVSGLGSGVATLLGGASSGTGGPAGTTSPTLTTPHFSSIVNTGTLTLPTSTDTLVGRATTDTLTNKTLTSPVISTIVNTGTLTLPTSTDTLVGRATTDTLTNKRVTKRTGTTSGPGATPTLDTDNYDLYSFTALAANITSMSTNLTGTPNTGDEFLMEFVDNGTPRTITWGASFQSSGVATLLATTVANKHHWLKLLYDGSKWTCMAVDATGY